VMGWKKARFFPSHHPQHLFLYRELAWLPMCSKLRADPVLSGSSEMLDQISGRRTEVSHVEFSRGRAQRLPSAGVYQPG
jgi:hypothetical protein